MQDVRHHQDKAWFSCRGLAVRLQPAGAAARVAQNSRRMSRMPMQSSSFVDLVLGRGTHALPESCRGNITVGIITNNCIPLNSTIATPQNPILIIKAPILCWCLVHDCAGHRTLKKHFHQRFTLFETGTHKCFCCGKIHGISWLTCVSRA